MKFGQNLFKMLKQVQIVQIFRWTNDGHYSDAYKCASTECNNLHNKMPITTRIAKILKMWINMPKRLINSIIHKLLQNCISNKSSLSIQK